MTDVRTFLEIRPGMRDRLQQAIEALVDVLDSLEPDVDLEDNGDDELTGDEEPRLGSTASMHQGHAWKVPTDEADEGEPSLGARFNDHDQRAWANSDTTDREDGDDNGLGDTDGAAEQVGFHVGFFRWVE
jgi:hypothetical protein